MTNGENYRIGTLEPNELEKVIKRSIESKSV